MTNELTRESLIRDLEWLLENTTVPEFELPPDGKVWESIDDHVRSLRRGQSCIISRRYINAILRHLREET